MSSKDCLPASLTQREPPIFYKLYFRPTEPMSGVIEGISAGMFLIAMLVGVTALLICRQKARKV